MLFRMCAAIAALTLFAGCASSSGAYAVGDGSYKVTTSAFTSMGGAATAKKSAVKSANEFCAKQGKTAIITGDASQSEITQGSADVTFKCEAAGS
jgi:putative hemolysin